MYKDKLKVMSKKPSFGFEKKNFGSPKGVGILAPIPEKPVKIKMKGGMK
jgi:hypothetical protein